MSDEMVTKSSVSLDPPFENQTFPCFSIRIFRDKEVVQVLEDKEIKKTFRLSSFPEELDLDSVDAIASMIKIVKEEGVESLRKRYKLRSVRPK